MAAQAAMTALGAVAQAANVTYYACVSSTGAITIVSATTTCAAGFTKIHWNETGPAGPKGATGATGPKGATGPAGPKGQHWGYRTTRSRRATRPSRNGWERYNETVVATSLQWQKLLVLSFKHR
jgi:hypothetical protein